MNKGCNQWIISFDKRKSSELIALSVFRLPYIIYFSLIYSDSSIVQTTTYNLATPDLNHSRICEINQ